MFVLLFLSLSMLDSAGVVRGCARPLFELHVADSRQGRRDRTRDLEPRARSMVSTGPGVGKGGSSRANRVSVRRRMRVAIPGPPSDLQTARRAFLSAGAP
jgi:hypothetical protein